MAAWPAEPRSVACPCLFATTARAVPAFASAAHGAVPDGIEGLSESPDRRFGSIPGFGAWLAIDALASAAPLWLEPEVPAAVDEEWP